MDGLPVFRLTFAPAYLYVISRSTYLAYLLHLCRHRHQIITHRYCCCPSPVQAEHLSFSLCDWNSSFENISFSFLPSMQLKHVILIIAADMLHFSLAMCKPAM